jgi:hypothetical protein
MRASYLLVGAGLTLCSAWALAQEGPESLLPKMFDNPAPVASPKAPAARPSSTPASSQRSQPRAISTPVVQEIRPENDPAAQGTAAADEQPASKLKRIPSLQELAKMTPADFEELLGDDVVFDTPPQARRSMTEAGLLSLDEGGFPSDSLASQNGALIRLALSANKGTLVSRWGHIVLRRALISRLRPPAGMTPQEFLALRAELLLRMGETDAARSIVQDIDIADYTPSVGAAAFRVYENTADFTGLCPIMATQGDLQDTSQWNLVKIICEAFRGNSTAALAKLDRQVSRGTMPKIDLLLAQKYAGAAGKARRAVTIEWDDVRDMTPWRYGLAIGVGLEPPERLLEGAGPRYSYVTALAPMAGLERRAAAAERAGAAGILSNAAMVDLYSQIYADPNVTGDWQSRAEALNTAYTQESPALRLSAMEDMWNGAADSSAKYARQVLTAAAAARISPSEDGVESSAALIASMLSAGYDANAMRWAPLVPAGSDSWGMLALAAPGRSDATAAGAINDFIDRDESAGKKKAGFLVAGLAGLDRLGNGDAGRYSNDLGLRLDQDTRWTKAIDSAAERGDAASVVLLAGFGMQGANWHHMTPRYLYHIVSALRRVGLDAEARMIAAEAVARA